MADVAIVAVGSMHGSPGATRLALDLATLLAGDTLLIEADPDGGCLAARLDLALRPGLTELAGAARVGIAGDDLWRFAQRADCATAVIVASPAAEQVHAALRVGAAHVAAALAAVAHHVVIDVGRIRPGSPALGLAACADHLLIVSHNSVEAVVSITHRTELLRGLAPAMVILPSLSPYSATEIAATVGQTVWGVVPDAHTRRSTQDRTRAIHRLVDTLTVDDRGAIDDEDDVDQSDRSAGAATVIVTDAVMSSP